jgi:hypothetical protein
VQILKGDKMKKSQAALHLGLNKSYFYTTRARSPDKYKYMMALDEDPVTAYRKYEQEQDQMLRKLEDIYYTLLDLGKMYHFSRTLASKGIYKHRNHFSTVIGKIVGKVDPKFKYNAFLKLKVVVDEYNKYMEEHHENT